MKNYKVIVALVSVFCIFNIYAMQNQREALNQLIAQKPALIFNPNNSVNKEWVKEAMNVLYQNNYMPITEYIRDQGKFNSVLQVLWDALQPTLNYYAAQPAFRNDTWLKTRVWESLTAVMKELQQQGFIPQKNSTVVGSAVRDNVVPVVQPVKNDVTPFNPYPKVIIHPIAPNTKTSQVDTMSSASKKPVEDQNISKKISETKSPSDQSIKVFNSQDEFARHLRERGSSRIADAILGSAQQGPAMEQEKTAECCICLEEKGTVEIPCKNKHSDRICKNCLSQINTCPICRGPLTK